MSVCCAYYKCQKYTILKRVILKCIFFPRRFNSSYKIVLLSNFVRRLFLVQRLRVLVFCLLPILLFCFRSSLLNHSQKAGSRIVWPGWNHWPKYWLQIPAQDNLPQNKRINKNTGRFSRLAQKCRYTFPSNPSSIRLH